MGDPVSQVVEGQHDLDFRSSSTTQPQDLATLETKFGEIL